MMKIIEISFSLKKFCCYVQAFNCFHWVNVQLNIEGQFSGSIFSDSIFSGSIFSSSIFSGSIFSGRKTEVYVILWCRF